MEHLGLWNAEVVAERFRPLLRLAQVRLGDHRAFRLEVLERLDLVGVEAGLVPLLAIERRLLVGVPAHFAQALHDGALAISRGHRLALGEPVAASGLRPVRIVVARRPRPVFHLAHSRPPFWAYLGPRSRTRRRTVSTITLGGVSLSRISATPIFFSAVTSSSGITPPPRRIMSLTPLSSRRFMMRGKAVMWAPESRLTPSTSTSSWTAASTTSSGVRCRPV